MRRGQFRWLDRPCRRIGLLTALGGMLGTLGMLAGAPAAGGAQQVPTTLALRGVTVIDVRDGRLYPAQTVVVVGSRVRAVGPVEKVRVPRGTRVIDAQGKYLIPGLWDMHLHTRGRPDVFYPLLIANGITGIRDPLPITLWFPFDSARRWQQQVATGARVGPRQPLLFGGSVMVGPTLDARRFVDSLRAAGADFIKNYLTLPSTARDATRHAYFALLAEARHAGIQVLGHLPADVTVAEASDSGQRTLEHLQFLAAFRHLQGSCEGDAASLAKCTALAKRLRRNDTWITPTIGLTFYPPQAGAAALRPIVAQLPYLTEAARRVSSLDSGAAATDARYGVTKTLVTMMQRVDMPLLAGSDSDIPPWLTVHEELAALVELGVTPLGALQAATLNPAKYWHATDSLGTVTPGKLADLVLLDANPLADIHNTAAVRAVVANGRYFDRAALDGLLAEVVERVKADSNQAPRRDVAPR